FSNVMVQSGDAFTRPSAGGGGFGDPLERPVEEVLEDVIDEYVSVERAKRDYGVVINVVDAELDQYEVDDKATRESREYIRSHRKDWLEEDPASVADRY